jgi:peptidoglycan/xylan/chitin deacetylase (PgdA/CDA1 family)
MSESDIGTTAEMEEVADELRSRGSKVSAIPCDVRKEEDCDALIDAAVAEFGAVNILVNNAGIGYIMKPLLETSGSEWEAVIGVNLSGAFYCSRAAARHMVERGQGGRIINIASQAAKSGFPHMAPYCSSKHGMIGLTRSNAVGARPLRHHRQRNLPEPCHDRARREAERLFLQAPRLRQRRGLSRQYGEAKPARAAGPPDGHRSGLRLACLRRCLLHHRRGAQRLGRRGNALMREERIDWPGGAKIALSIVVNVEEGSGDDDRARRPGMEPVDELGIHIKAPIRNYGNESNYLYGIKAGAPRIVKLLREHQVMASWTVAAMSLENHPEIAEAIAALGHEPVSHGWRWIHQFKMDEAQEAEFIDKAVASIEQSVGRAPYGWLSRYLHTDNTRRLLIERGFAYHMDDYSGDVPFWDRETVPGRPIVIVPYQLDTNDMKMWTDPAMTPAQWLDYARRSFDQLYREGEEGSPKMMSLGCTCASSAGRGGSGR